MTAHSCLLLEHNDFTPVSSASSTTSPRKFHRTYAVMSWPGGTNRAKHPSSTLYSPQGVPQYPPGTTCKALSEQDPYFPVTWHLYLLTLVVVLLYIVWPLYVLRHLCRKVR